MAQVSVVINGRRFDIACDDGQEPHVLRLAEDVDARVGQLAANIGQVGEARLLVLASLLLANDIHELRAELAFLRGAENGHDGHAGSLAALVDALAQRVEGAAQRLAAGAPPAAIAERDAEP